MPYLEKEDTITPEESQEVADLVVKYQGVEMAKDIAHRYTQKALVDIETLPDGEAKEMLQLLTTQLLLRSY